MNALEIGLYNKLKADSTLIAALSSTKAIYNSIAPQGTSKPYVIFAWAGGGLENLNPSELRNTVYLVKAVASDLSEAGTIQGYIFDALHKQTLTVSGYTNFYMACEDEIQLVETPRDASLIFHRGYYVRIRLDD